MNWSAEFAAAPRSILKEYPLLDAHQMVLVTPTPDKYVKYAHSIGEQGDWMRTRCGIGVGQGFLWNVFHARLIQSEWCGECW